MPIFGRIKDATASLVKRAASFPALSWGYTGSLLQSFGRTLVGTNTSGVSVNPRTALSFPGCFSAVNTISTDLASLPLHLVQVMDDGTERKAKEHPAYNLFDRSPDGGGTTPMRWRQAIISHSLLYGNGYGEIVYSADGSRVYLFLLNPETTIPNVGADGTITYRVNGQVVDREKILHVAGLSFNGLEGYSIPRVTAQAFGIGLASERFSGSVLGNSASTSGFIKSPHELTPEAAAELLDAFNSRNAGSGNAGRVGILPPGYDFESTATSAADAQLTELRRFQILEMARLYRLPPHKLGDYSNASYSSIEASNLEYLQTTLLPGAEQFEQALNLRLLTEEEQAAGFRFKHDFKAYLRADAAGRANMYKTLFSTGAMSPNEIRAAEGLDPRDDGDQFYVMLNMGPNDPNPNQSPSNLTEPSK
jgi:HK97 family phage portal protein